MVLLPLSPLRHRNFRLLFLSQLISLLGSQMTLVTIPFQIYAITHSTFQTGLVSAIELICLVATALFGGVVADKFNRRNIIVGAEIILIGMVVTLAINASLDEPSLWLIYILAGLGAGVNGFHRPAFESLTPLLVPKSELPNISALLSTKFVVASLMGPTIAGFFVATIGPLLTYCIDAASFAISLVLLTQITQQDFGTKSDTPSTNGSVVRDIVDGARYILSRKDILGSYIIDFVAMVFCMPQVLFPAFAQHYQHNEWLGALYSAIGFGGLVATLVSRWTSSVQRLGLAIFCASAGWAISIFCAGLAPSFWFLAGALFFAGICDGYSGIFRLTMWNESLPNSLRGRIASFGMLSYTSGPLLGNTIIGFLGDIVGIHQALSIGGALSLMIMTVVIFGLPAFFKYRSDCVRVMETDSKIS